MVIFVKFTIQNSILNLLVIIFEAVWLYLIVDKKGPILK